MQRCVMHQLADARHPVACSWSDMLLLGLLQDRLLGLACASQRAAGAGPGRGVCAGARRCISWLRHRALKAGCLHSVCARVTSALWGPGRTLGRHAAHTSDATSQPVCLPNLSRLQRNVGNLATHKDMNVMSCELPGCHCKGCWGFGPCVQRQACRPLVLRHVRTCQRSASRVPLCGPQAWSMQ